MLPGVYLNKKKDWKNKYICRFIKNNFDSIFKILLNIEEYAELFGQISKLGAPKMLGVKLLFIKWNL